MSRQKQISTKRRNKMSKILIIGANGSVGTELSKDLKARGHEVVGATSKKEAIKGQVHLDLITGEGVEGALKGVEKLFLLTPPGHVNQNELLAPLIDEAKKAHVEKVVLMTAMGANSDENAPLRKAEVQLENSSLNYNIIRPNWFMQNFNSYWIEGINTAGKIFLPVEKASGSFIDVRDIAAVAAELLVNDKWNKEDFDLTGADVLNHDEVASLLSSKIGREITYENISADAMLEGLLSGGLSRPYSEFLNLILDFFRLGFSERKTDSVEQILGRAPIRFEQYLEDYKASWQV
jgi:uncharacterized protein YbjT (DUF2867 family)